MSGVNAHALVEGAGAGKTALPPAPVAWRRARAWPAPPHHALLWRGGASAAAARFTAVLATPSLAHLGHHVVAGRPILPGAAMLEAGLAAVATLGGSADEEGGNGRACLAGATLPAPVLLTPPLASLEVVVDQADGSVTLAALGSGRPSPAGAGGVGGRRGRLPAPNFSPPPPAWSAARSSSTRPHPGSPP